MGRPQFATPGTDKGGQTVAVNEKPQLSNINKDQSANVASGSTETVELYAPTDASYQVIGMRLFVGSDGDATSGTHSLKVKPLNARNVLWGRANYNSNVAWQYGHWYKADNSAQPGDEAAARAILESVRATDAEPLVISYENNTDVAQERPRSIDIQVSEVSY